MPPIVLYYFAPRYDDPINKCKYFQFVNNFHLYNHFNVSAPCRIALATIRCLDIDVEVRTTIGLLSKPFLGSEIEFRF